MTGAGSSEPEYSIEEDNNFINVTIPAPLSRPDSAAIVLEGNVLTFDTPPYLLRLKLPSKVVDDFSDVKFDGQSGIYTVKLKKDLSSNGIVEQEEDDDEDCEERKLILQELGNEKVIGTSETGNQFYGFGNLYSKMFSQHYDEFSDVFDVPYPDSTDPKERTTLRKKDVEKKWDADHYLADNMEPESSNVDDYLNYNPFWERTPLCDDLSKDENEVLDNLTKKDWMKSELSDEMRKICELQMIDVLFAYAYNKRVTEGDNSVTSAWNITKLSATLSWFEVFENVKEVLVSCYKRCLTYPLCRNWDLAEAVQKDVKKILSLGPKIITRCFLEVRDIFNETDNYYVLNTLYINDLAHFANKLEKNRTTELSRELNMKITKQDLNLDLPLLEMAACLVLNEENGIEDEEVKMSIVMDKLAKLGLNINKFSGSGSESSDSESSEETDESDESDEIPDGDNSLSEGSDDDCDEGEEEEESSDDGSDDESDDDDDDDDEDDWESCEEEETDEEEEDDDDDDTDEDEANISH